MQTVRFFTLGCKANQYDTQLIREGLLCAGLKEAQRTAAPDIYVINTCTVTRNADRDSLQLIRRARRENPAARIVVTGCLAEKDAAAIAASGKRLILVRNKDKQRIPSLLGYGSSGISGISTFAGHTRAFLKIQDGCDNFCSYCKVPFVRGRSRSKDICSIVKEARALAANGFREIVLCGICLGAYGRDLPGRTRLVQVIDALEEIGGILRIRLSSIEFSDVTAALIRRLGSKGKLCRHLHIPLQSGDDRVLAQMRRNYRSADYIRLVKKLKTDVPGIAITTDVMVGFPGEKEENFRNTLKTVAATEPLKVHIFPYSVRPGTLASRKFPEALDPGLVRERAGRLKTLAEKLSREYRGRFLGRTLQVLFEERSRARSGYWEGHTDNYIRVALKCRADIANTLVRVRLNKLENTVMLGTR